MACNSDYLAPHSEEIEATKIVALLDELDGKGQPNPKTYNSGLDKRVYNNANNNLLDSLTQQLCSRLQLEKDISVYSLELQIWWRDHQAADKKRVEEELRINQRTKDKADVLKKLTPYDRSFL